MPLFLAGVLLRGELHLVEPLLRAVEAVEVAGQRGVEVFVHAVVAALADDVLHGIVVEADVLLFDVLRGVGGAAFGSTSSSALEVGLAAAAVALAAAAALALSIAARRRVVLPASATRPVLLGERLLNLDLADEVLVDLGDGLAEVEMLAGLDANLEAIAEAGLVLRREHVTAFIAELDHEEGVGEDVRDLNLAGGQVGHPEADRRDAHGGRGLRRPLLPVLDNAISVSFEFAFAEPLGLQRFDAGLADMGDPTAHAPAEVDVLLEREDEGRVRKPLKVQARMVAAELRAGEHGQIEPLRQGRLDVLALIALRLRSVLREADEGVEHIPLLLEVPGVGVLVAVEAALPQPFPTS